MIIKSKQEEVVPVALDCMFSVLVGKDYANLLNVVITC